MNRIKKCILLTLAIVFPFLTINAQAETNAACRMNYQTAKHGKTKIDISSDHSFSIFNNNSSPKTYVVQYTNGIMYQNPYYSPNANKTLTITVPAGQTVAQPAERVGSPAYFSLAGNYLTQAETTIKLDGKLIAHCTNKNIAAIF